MGRDGGPFGIIVLMTCFQLIWPMEFGMIGPRSQANPAVA